MPKMLRINPSKQAVKFTERLPAKQQKQIAEKISSLRVDPMPYDSQQLQGKLNIFRRVTCGEYRIAYLVDSDILHIVAIAKRNDDEIYRLLKMKY
jgi:mRNA-degrading endonuclease RelE of RelBE toxin-antitoxin system